MKKKKKKKNYCFLFPVLRLLSAEVGCLPLLCSGRAATPFDIFCEGEGPIEELKFLLHNFIKKKEATNIRSTLEVKAL